MAILTQRSKRRTEQKRVLDYSIITILSQFSIKVKLLHFTGTSATTKVALFFHCTESGHWQQGLLGEAVLLFALQDLSNSDL
jgi:hypothetical protein